jgi:hypothetical protein
MEKDPTNYGILTYLWVLILSIWGGTAHTIRKVRAGAIDRFSLSEWIGDCVISGFLGVITFWLCEYGELNQLLTAAIVGISAHQGTRGIMVLEKYIAQKIGIRDGDLR